MDCNTLGTYCERQAGPIELRIENGELRKTEEAAGSCAPFSILRGELRIENGELRRRGAVV
jgi:hypothetical protein